MSTWHCFITVMPDKNKQIDLEQIIVLMAGENEPVVSTNEDGSRVFSYQSSYPMPAATFALAVGTWPLYCASPAHGSNCFETERSHSGPSFRIFSPRNFHVGKLERLNGYLPACFHALNSVLGSYPLQRLDILVVPESFDSMGMMCPHLMFLSQSVLLCDTADTATGMFYRVAHELCHTWLGVLTGPRDWTEEWLTEGICCYLEDVVHAQALRWSEHEMKERLELRKLLKYRVLRTEMNTTGDDLQKLRPSGDIPCSSSSNMDITPSVVINGLNPEKTFLQVHYLKGFFLLKHLEMLSGREDFLHVLRTFIQNNMGQLFSSQELLKFCFQELPRLRQSSQTVEQVCEEWLDTPGMPQPLVGFKMDERNLLYTEVQHELSLLKADACRKKRRTSALESLEPDHALQMRSSVGQRSSLLSPLSSKVFLPEQSILLLDLLVEANLRPTISQLEWLRDRLRVQDAAAEVQHSWCEVVICNKAVRFLPDVERFLTQHQAMGVYLYGELMISRHARLQALARRVFQRLRPCMAEAQRRTVQEMLYPT